MNSITMQDALTLCDEKPLLESAVRVREVMVEARGDSDWVVEQFAVDVDDVRRVHEVIQSLHGPDSLTKRILIGYFDEEGFEPAQVKLFGDIVDWYHAR